MDSRWIRAEDWGQDVRHVELDIRDGAQEGDTAEASRGNKALRERTACAPRASPICYKTLTHNSTKDTELVERMRLFESAQTSLRRLSCTNETSNRFRELLQRARAAGDAVSDSTLMQCSADIPFRKCIPAAIAETSPSPLSTLSQAQSRVDEKNSIALFDQSNA